MASFIIKIIVSPELTGDRAEDPINCHSPVELRLATRAPFCIDGIGTPLFTRFKELPPTSPFAVLLPAGAFGPADHTPLALNWQLVTPAGTVNVAPGITLLATEKSLS